MNPGYIFEIKYADPVNRRSYLAALPVVKHLARQSIVLERPVTIFVGENGTFNPEGGTKNFDFSTNATHSELHEHLRLSRKAYAKDGFFLRAESLYNVATNIDELDQAPSFGPPLIESYGGVSLHEQSHGESFLAIVQNRFGGNGLYILDEPEAALSPMRILTLIAEIDRLVKENAQFIIATHSPMLMAMPNAQILELSDDGIRAVQYADTEHYRTMRDFLNNPEKVLHYLLRE